jgi:hypothetical protein
MIFHKCQTEFMRGLSLEYALNIISFLKTLLSSFAFDWIVMFCEGWCKPVIHTTVM